MQSIEAIRFEVEQVGKHVKGSKKRYCWQIALKDKHHTIALDFSFISSKVKIVVDRKILLQNELPSNVSFQYPFTLDGFALNIIQQGQSFQLRINNKVFSHLYIQKKTNSQFKKYEEEVKDIKIDFNQNNNQKKISLNIGALGGANMKKKKQSNQSQGWNAMAGPGSFPSYFGQTESQQKKSQSLTSSQTTTSNKDLFSFAEQKAQKNQNLLEEPLVSVSNTKPNNPSQNFFELNISSQQFTTEQPRLNQTPNEDLFSSFNLNSQKNNIQIDFFAQEPKKSQIVQPKATSNNENNLFSNNNKANNSMLDINFGSSQPSNINMSSFATGYGVKQQQPQSKINANNFATSNPNQLTDLSFDLFANSNPIKPAQNKMNFSKKPSHPQQSSILTQIDNLTLNTSTNSLSSNPTPISPALNLNAGFPNTAFNNQQKIDLNDFSTMQLLFQSNSGSNSMAGFQQQFSTNSQRLPQQGATIPQDFGLNQHIQPQINTSQTNLTGLTLNMNPPINNTKKLDLGSFDFSLDRPSSQFNTSSGVFNMNSNVNQNKFSTYQFNPTQPLDLQFNFLQTKPKNPAPATNNLI